MILIRPTPKITGPRSGLAQEHPLTFHNRFTVSLPCPLNALYMPIPVTGKGGRRFSKMVHTRRGTARANLIVAEIHKQCGGYAPEPFAGPVQVQVAVYPRNRQSADSDAYLKQLFDCLQKSGVIVDDKQIVGHVVERMAPESPGRVEVEIFEV